LNAIPGKATTKDKHMVTRTASTVDGTGEFREVSLRWIDAVGDIRSDATIIDAGATDVQIEAVAAAMQAASNASLYAIRVTDVYEGAKSKGNADSAVRESLQDNIVFHAKDSGRVDRRSFVPAPLAAVFVADTETPDEGELDCCPDGCMGNHLGWHFCRCVAPLYGTARNQ